LTMLEKDDNFSVVSDRSMEGFWGSALEEWK
jgi:hypothetical protein